MLRRVLHHSYCRGLSRMITVTVQNTWWQVCRRGRSRKCLVHCLSNTWTGTSIKLRLVGGRRNSQGRSSDRLSGDTPSPPLEQPGMMSSVEDVALNALFETILTSTAQPMIRNIVERCVHCHCRIGTQFAIMFLACFDHSDLHEQGTSRLSLRSFFARS